MNVAGFTFIRNAILYDYPIVEAIRSILPLCAEVVVAVGRSDDETLDLVRGIGHPNLRIVETVWDDTLRQGGQVLAQETNKAFDAVGADYDWCVYIQGDECLHEGGLPALRAAMTRWADDPQTAGLLLPYRHFYGSYDYVGVSRRWYRREIRVVRNNKQIRSWRDAQGFRYADGRKINARLVNAPMHHYGWVRPPDAQQRKQRGFNRLWHSDTAVQQMVGDATLYPYDGSEPLERFTGTHPAVMLPRIGAINWQFDSDPATRRHSLKERLSRWVETKTGYRPGEYQNYRLL